MSAPMLSGLYSRLKDRSLSCTDRLKLARFGWKTPAVFVPNKEQVILDWLTGLLVNKKKFGLNDSDVEQVWATLHDILQTKKYARKTNISIKNSFTSVLAEYITHYGTRDVSVGSLASVLRCCHVILTSTTMSTLFTTKFDALVALVAALLNTAAHQLRVGTTTSEQLRSILTFVLPKFTTLATKQINQRQVLTWLTDKLLTPSLYVIRRMGRHGDGGRESSAVRTLLQQLVDSLLLHDDHAHSYLVFLSARYVAEATKLQPPKHVDHAMQCLVSGVRCGAGDDRDAIIDYLPLFLEAFMKSYGDAEASAGFRMLRYLWEAVELTGDAECRLAASAELLGVAHACAVFGQAIDDAGREDERCWMEERVTSLLACDGDAHGSAAWGRCMLQLLRVDHTVVEARVVTVMDACLTPHSECGDAVLTALLDTYARMRRLDKFTLKLLAAVRGNARQGAWRFPRTFMGRLRYDGYDDDRSADFWCDMTTSEVHRIGWCGQNCKVLQPPDAIRTKYSDWSQYLVHSLSGASTVPAYLLNGSGGTTPIDQIKQGMPLEIMHALNPSKVWLARVIEHIGA
ncbi:PREDICTED: unhealthy ribosome biogenesis protein 2 homolog [Priapulus caudatus]|uniref:Unhealthy ribosome biogenesis protein 2 homolog n=1 Tax=Priapulus caudatus TaxID=37621 RepID=A0ABM1F479_PRICU|nr:PREDICTED: unhealthy ribosome biogenesis protein 2 homolog [Priapulus caudatus]